MLHGEFPARYESWMEEFAGHFLPRMRPGWQILDVGAGRQPTIAKVDRAAACTYVGQDLSKRELEAAPPGSYDEIVVGDVLQYRPELADRFDLIVSYQVLEHVRPLDQALANLRSYLRPGGQLVAQFSGAFSYFALASRLVPHRLTVALLTRLTKRDPRSIFPAYYNRCWFSALQRTMAGWSEVTICPMWGGSTYLAFSPALAALNIGYESWAMAGNHNNLATHYIVDATR